jgi:hypothetical protein
MRGEAFAVVIALTVGVPGVYAAASAEHLPDQVRRLLDAEYRGWTFPTIAKEDIDLCWPPHSPYEPTLLWADFDGDAKIDYAVEVEVKGTSPLLVFLARGSSYEKRVVDADLRQAGILTLAKRGTRYFDHERNRSGTYSLDTISVIYCEKSQVSYVHGPKGFARVFVAD